MLGMVETEGIITKEVKYGDSSRIVTIITRDFGKISAIANNVRSNKSKLLPGIQLFSYGKFFMFQGKDKGLYRINEIDTIEPFKNIRESLEALAYASYFAEIANRVVGENDADLKFLSLLLNTLYATDRKISSLAKIKTVFELRTAVLSGYAPNLDGCAVCHSEENPTFLKIDEGKLLCKNCGKNKGACIEVNRAIVDAIEYICWIDEKKIFSFEMSESMLNYIGCISEIYLSTQLDCEFSTLEYLKKVISL